MNFLDEVFLDEDFYPGQYMGGWAPASSCGLGGPSFSTEVSEIQSQDESFSQQMSEYLLGVEKWARPTAP